MFNLFGALGALSRILPGYMNGYRTAISDNWKDLSNYNQVQAGQINNAFQEAIFNDMVNMQKDAAGISRMNALNSGMDTTLNYLKFPSMVQQMVYEGQNMPALLERQLGLTHQNLDTSMLNNAYNQQLLQMMQQMGINLPQNSGSGIASPFSADPYKRTEPSVLGR